MFDKSLRGHLGSTLLLRVLDTTRRAASSPWCTCRMPRGYGANCLCTETSETKGPNKISLFLSCWWSWQCIHPSGVKQTHKGPNRDCLPIGCLLTLVGITFLFVSRAGRANVQKPYNPFLMPYWSVLGPVPTAFIFWQWRWSSHSSGPVQSFLSQKMVLIGVETRVCRRAGFYLKTERQSKSW